MIKCFIDEGGLVEEGLKEYLMSDALVIKFLEGRVPLVCEAVFREAYLLSGAVEEAVIKLLASHRIPYSAGLYLGRLRNSRPRFIPSVTFLQKLLEVAGRPYRALTVGLEGLKPFLYGRDLLKASVIDCHPPVVEGDTLAVLGRDNYVYGVGLSLINSCSDLRGLGRTDPVALHVFDVGWFLRGGTEARERRYTILRS